MVLHPVVRRSAHFRVGAILLTRYPGGGAGSGIRAGSGKFTIAFAIIFAIIVWIVSALHYPMKFTAKIQLGGKTATGIQVPNEVIAQLGSNTPAVLVTINKYTYRTTIGRMRGKFMIPLSADNREKAAVAAGE